MSDKRSVATDALETLGTIIDETAKRDAIHLAVIQAAMGVASEPGIAAVVSRQRVRLRGIRSALGATSVSNREI